MRSGQGFTLIELLVVLVIIAIVAFIIAFGFYRNFVWESQVFQDTIPYGRNCLMDLLMFCTEHPNETVDISKFENCLNRTSLTGRINFEIPPLNCTSDGKLPEGFSIKVFSTISNKYFLKCQYQPGGIKCSIEPNPNS